jgi:phosphatidylinositol kinase/protein kinase (PI-3  family)
MQLLGGNYLDSSIRKFAVNSLSNLSYLNINDYLMQLIQALKYELYHDSHLARFLLRLALKYPLTIGHQMFWVLKSEMHNISYQQRFGIILNAFLLKIDPKVRQIFKDECWLIDSLKEISKIAFMKDVEVNKALQDALNHLNIELNGRQISIPYNYKIKIKSIRSEKCKFMKSKKRPIWLVFENSDALGDDIFIIFKKGDDLRQDIITLQLFQCMNNLWKKNSHKTKMSLYNVISTGYYCGVLEVVKNSETLAYIHKEYSLVLGGFSDKPLKLWMDKNVYVSQEECINNFLLSSAAYCVATFVLGIGDRHNDNIMIKRVLLY